LHRSNIAIDRGMAQVASVPIMTIALALYMGFRRIYLLGTDHAALFTGEYHYFFDRSRTVLKDTYAHQDGKRNYDLMLDLTVNLHLWRQYAALRAIAEARGAEIVNLAKGSYLDVFPRASLAEIVARP